MPARFPETPPSAQAFRLPERRPMSDRKPAIVPTSNAEIIKNKAKAAAETGPVIPVTVLDPAQQRLYAVAIFCVLQALKVGCDQNKLTVRENAELIEN